MEEMIHIIVVANMLPPRDDYALYVGPTGDGQGGERKAWFVVCVCVW